MKRQKGNSSEQKSIKRQKSHIDDKLSGIENTPDDEQLECANLQAENGKALVDNHQDVASNLQRDDVDGRYLDGTATNEAHKSEQKRSVERNEQVDDAKRSTCGKPRVIKSENNGGKSRPGFGFTRDTEQYRSLENRQSSTDFRRETRSTNRNVKKKCEGRTNPGNKKIENNFPRFDAKYAELKPSVIPSGKCLYKTVNKGPTFDADDTEMDSIFTCKTTVKTLEHAPKQAPVDYADMCPKSLPPKHSMIMCMIPTGQVSLYMSSASLIHKRYNINIDIESTIVYHVFIIDLFPPVTVWFHSFDLSIMFLSLSFVGMALTGHRIFIK